VDAQPGIQRSSAADVDDEPALLEAQVLHPGADQVTDGAVRAVAAEHRGHPVPDHLTGRGVSQNRRDAGGVLLQSDQLDPAGQGRVRV
jgi:hypothetical protein